MAQRYFGFLNATRAYFKSLASQAVGLPSYGVQLQWDNFIRTLSPRPTNASMVQPRNLAAYYPNDSTAIYLDGSNNVTLWEDRSGNSATNCLCMNAGSNNSAQAASSSALNVIRDIALVIDLRVASWTSGTQNPNLIAKRGASSQLSYSLGLSTSTGILSARFSSDGNSNAGELAICDAAVPFGSFQRAIIAVAKTGTSVRFLYSIDAGSTWTQLGTTQTVTNTTIFASTSTFQIGANSDLNTGILTGNVFEVWVYNGVPAFLGGAGATIALDANFANAPKLASSFIESSPNAATITINSVGDTGARVAGERDLYQGTSTKRPVYTAAVGRNRLSVVFDGVDDFMKTSSFSAAQPETIYLVAVPVTWSVNATIFDGFSSSSQFRFYQNTSTPGINFSTDNVNFLGFNATWPVSERAIISIIANGAISSLQVNRRLPTSGNSGVSSGLGLTLASNTGSTTFANVAVSELVLYSNEAHSATTRANIIGYFANKYQIGL